MNDAILLQTSGRGFTTRSGRAIVLRGVGLGGWMNMENFITGYPATETLQRAALRRALGENAYRRFYQQHEASWALWTYKDIGLQGLVYASPDSPYLRRLQPVLEKKARLGVDAWGSTDAGVRHLLEPIEETFRQEFPRFDPFPFGVRSWIHGLVRHVLLAEPLVDDFARCFEGMGSDEAARLADSFRFDACLKRERLLDILRSAATP